MVALEVVRDVPFSEGAIHDAADLAPLGGVVVIVESRGGDGVRT